MLKVKETPVPCKVSLDEQQTLTGYSGPPVFPPIPQALSTPYQVVIQWIKTIPAVDPTTEAPKLDLLFLAETKETETFLSSIFKMASNHRRFQ